MRKYWHSTVWERYDFTLKQIRKIEAKYNIKVIPCCVEHYVEELFLRNYEKMGFERVCFREVGCFEKIWKRIGVEIDFKGVDYIGWKDNEPYTIELETWASFVRFHEYSMFLDYVVCLQKDNWNYGYAQVIELWKVLGVKEIITRDELENFLYENNPAFREFYDKVVCERLATKMGIKMDSERFTELMERKR